MSHIEPLYVDIEGAIVLTSLSKSTIEAEVRAGNFPKPRQLAGRRTGYLVTEVKAWAESRPVSDLPPPPNTGHATRRRKPAESIAPAAMPAAT